MAVSCDKILDLSNWKHNVVDKSNWALIIAFSFEREKTLWEKEKILAFTNFFLSHNILKKYFSS